MQRKHRAFGRKPKAFFFRGHGGNIRAGSGLPQMQDWTPRPDQAHRKMAVFRAFTGRKALFLPFRRVEIILCCFQIGRMSEWARAHFFVGGDIFRQGQGVRAAGRVSAGSQRFRRT